MENPITLIQIIESVGVPLAILISVLYIFYKKFPEIVNTFLTDYRTMNDNFTEVVKTNTQAMTELQATMKSGNELNKSSFQRVHDRLDNLADKEDLKLLHGRVSELADIKNLNQLHSQIDKLERLILKMMGGDK